MRNKENDNFLFLNTGQNNLQCKIQVSYISLLKMRKKNQINFKRDTGEKWFNAFWLLKPQNHKECNFLTKKCFAKLQSYETKIWLLVRYLPSYCMIKLIIRVPTTEVYVYILCSNLFFATVTLLTRVGIQKHYSPLCYGKQSKATTTATKQ